MSPNTDKVLERGSQPGAFVISTIPQPELSTAAEENNNSAVARLLSHCESQLLFLVK